MTTHLVAIKIPDEQIAVDDRLGEENIRARLSEIFTDDGDAVVPDLAFIGQRVGTGAALMRLAEVMAEPVPAPGGEVDGFIWRARHDLAEELLAVIGGHR